MRSIEWWHCRWPWVPPNHPIFCILHRHMQVCTSLQITTPAPHHSEFLQARCPSCRPINSVKALKAELQRDRYFFLWWYLDNAGYAVHEVFSFNVGGQIRLVEGKASSNEKWKVKLHSSTACVTETTSPRHALAPGSGKGTVQDCRAQCTRPLVEPRCHTWVNSSAGTVRETVYRRRWAFPVAGPTVWNSLPDNVISAPSLSTFRQRLKTFLLQPSFPDIIIDPW